MPETPITRKKSPILISRYAASKVDCAKLHAGAFHSTGSRDINIILKPGSISMFDTFTAGPDVIVPNEPRFLDTLIPAQYDHASIQIEYTYASMLPDEKLTRAEFVMEVLEVWDRQYERLVGIHGETAPETTAGKVLLANMAALLAVYDYKELINKDEFDEYFVTEPELAAAVKIEFDTVNDTHKGEDYGHGV